MAKSILIFALTAVTLAGHGVSDAQLAGAGLEFQPRGASGRAAKAAIFGSGVGVPRPVEAASDPPAVQARAFVYAGADLPTAYAPHPTSFDHRFGPDGPVGSVGYRRLPPGRPIALDEAGAGRSMRPSPPGVRFGAWLRFNFR